MSFFSIYSYAVFVVIGIDNETLMHASKMKSAKDVIFEDVAIAALPFELLHQHLYILLP